MGIETHKVPDHLNYFLCIEDDITVMSRWIDISKANFQCYSIELARLLMTTSAEVDVMAKLICKDLNPKSKARGINSYQEELADHFPAIINAEVLVPRYGLTLTPWTNWYKPKNPPLWWQATNKVKHHRSEYFHQATLKNVLNSVAGLFILILLYYGPKMEVIRPVPSLFEPRTFGYKDGSGIMYSPNLVPL